MTEYWKSQDRKYCEFCNAWMADNKTTIAFHENGKKHKMNLAKRLSTISKNSETAEREQKKMDIVMRKIDEAAMRSYAQDIHAGADLTARSVTAVVNAAVHSQPAPGTSGTQRVGRQVDPLRLPNNSDDEDERVGIIKVNPDTVPNASLWVEGRSEEDYPYYWNVKTGDSQWKKPKEGFLSYEEYLKINHLAEQQQEMKEAEDAKHFQNNVDETVARYNRERLKTLRRPEHMAENKKKALERETYKTQEEALAPGIGEWTTVTAQPPPPKVDLELPQIERWLPAQPTTVRTVAPPDEPPVKRFKEKVIESLEPDLVCNTSSCFKKRKPKGNMRQRTAEVEVKAEK